MTRKRSPEYDYVCRRCGVACEHDRHYRNGWTKGGLCKHPTPMLRRDYEAWMDQMAKDAVAAIQARRRWE